MKLKVTVIHWVVPPEVLTQRLDVSNEIPSIGPTPMVENDETDVGDRVTPELESAEFLSGGQTGQA